MTTGEGGARHAPRRPSLRATVEAEMRARGKVEGTWEELAEAFGCSAVTVKKHLNKMVRAGDLERVTPSVAPRGVCFVVPEGGSSATRPSTCPCCGNPVT